MLLDLQIVHLHIFPQMQRVKNLLGNYPEVPEISSGVTLTNVATQSWTAVTGFITILSTAWYKSQVISMWCEHDMAGFVEMSIWYVSLRHIQMWINIITLCFSDWAGLHWVTAMLILSSWKFVKFLLHASLHIQTVLFWTFVHTTAIDLQCKLIILYVANTLNRIWLNMHSLVKSRGYGFAILWVKQKTSRGQVPYMKELLWNRTRKRNG